MELKAEVLHLKTRDKYMTNEMEERNVQITKLKLLLERKQVGHLLQASTHPHTLPRVTSFSPFRDVTHSLAWRHIQRNKVLL